MFRSPQFCPCCGFESNGTLEASFAERLALSASSLQPSHKLCIHPLLRQSQYKAVSQFALFIVCFLLLFFLVLRFAEVRRRFLCLWRIQRTACPCLVWLKPNKNNKRSPKCWIAKTCDCIMKKGCVHCLSFRHFILVQCPSRRSELQKKTLEISFQS